MAASVGTTQCASDFSPSTYVVEVTQTNYCIMKVTSGSTIWTPPSGVLSFYILAVGGGGGGGNNAGGGGAGGGIAFGKITVNSSTSVSITVGAGGAAGVRPDGSTMDGKAGGASTVTANTNIGSITANGGAGGETHWSNNLCGGSGAPTVNVAGGAVSGSGTWSSITSIAGGVGGGWANNGVNAGAGGAGTSINITGSATIYGGGGGGGAWGASGGSGASGGGGNGGASGVAGSDGTSNTGGGGGGGGDGCSNGGIGGSGVVIIKWIPVPTLSPASSATTYFNRAGSFSSSATSSTTLTRSYQWMVSTNSGSAYANVSDGSGANSTNYSSATISSASSSYLYRMAVTDSDAHISSTGYSIGVAANTQLLPGGETDTALNFTGSTTSRAFAPNNSAFNVANAITIEAWVYVETITAGVWNIVLNKENSYQVGVSTTGKWAYALTSTNGFPTGSGVSTLIPVVKNEWHHIALTRAADSSTVNFYLDGNLVFSGSTGDAGTSPLYQSSLPFTIGGRTSDGVTFTSGFTGKIDHVMIFDSARQKSDITNDMKSYISTSTSNLKVYYDFNESNGTTLYNRVVGATSGSDLSINNATFGDVKFATTSGAYTVIKFPRTYLTSLGGWKVPSTVTRLSAVIVAGGGGGNGETDGTGWISGGGGAGGYLFTTSDVVSGSIQTVVVGQGGRRGEAVSKQIDTERATNGQDSIFLNNTAVGGGYGGGRSHFGDGRQNGAAGGSGGGGGTYQGTGGSGVTGQGNSGGGSIQGVSTCCTSGGGGGAGGPGGTATSQKGGDSGDGVLNPIFVSGVTELYLAGGGAGSSLYGTAGSAGTKGGTAFSTNGIANTGSGGGGGGGNANLYVAGFGGSGVVILRWITASVPSYTKPTNAYINVGMIETFTTNVAADSATVSLTRTFRWESSTSGSNGPFSLIKQGTGASNASFSWIPSDTSTSGSNFLYRLIVTDSDTAGLSITDSSTAYAIINMALVVSGTAGIAKTINLSKSETFTITLGTSTYRSTLTSNNPGITLDTTSSTSPVVKISETMTVGTYYETLTVTDSVSASVVTPLTIIVTPPPSLTAILPTIDTGTILYLDAGNSFSYNGSGTSWKDMSGRNLTTSIQPTSLPTTRNGPSSCTSPTYSRKNKGIFTFSKSNLNCAFVTDLGVMNKAYTYQVWFKRDGNQTDWTSVIATPYLDGTTPIAISLHFKTVSSSLRLEAGIWDSTGWNLATSSAQVPDLTWVMATVTFNGSNSLSLSLNAGTKVTSPVSVTWAPNTMDKGLFIGKRFDTNVDYFNGSVGMIRIYDRVLSDSEILQNYRASAPRFDPVNETDTALSMKYGVLSLESFTATSGYGSRTFTLSTGNKTGVIWDSQTVSDRINLTVGESLTAGTHYDTLTVTDSLGASSSLPFSFTIGKADTLTISMDTATTVVYNNAPITVYPKPIFKGLAGVDTLTVSTRFTSSTYTDSATVPTDVDTYTVIAANPVFAIGALSNYVNVVCETSTAKVTQANQQKLSINLYGAIAGTPFLIQTSGGSGDGPVTESVTAGSTATGCAVSNHVLSNTSPSTQQLTCNILVTKAASRNYKVETLTATVYFMLYVNNMPTNQVGSGSTIGLNGINSVWVDPGATPTITAITNPISATYAVLSSITISGSGFSLGPITIKFNRNQLGSGVSVASDTSLSVTIPAGAMSGYFSITNVNGTAFSPLPITIG